VLLFTGFLFGTRPGRELISPPPTPTPTPRPLDVGPERLAGTWVGTLGQDALVLQISPKGGDRVECALNAGTREAIAFEATVERRSGLVPRPLPGLEVSFGRAVEDTRGRLVLPLVDDRGRVRARLSRNDSPPVTRTEVMR
jgi:hypothetical protein